MFQNKLLFNQSSVSLEIIGLPDHSNNENIDQISIITQWKLTIIDRPLIEGNIDHLTSIMAAFCSYSNFLLNDQYAAYESSLIDIKAENYYTHNVLLKSTKPDIKPLKLKIGNSELSDIISCFDQFNSSNKVRKIKPNILNNTQKKGYLNLINKNQIFNYFLPPILSLISILFVSTISIYFYNLREDKEKNVSNYSKIIVRSMKSINTIL